MPLPPSFLRAYAGLEARTGRTVVLAGPPTSGKSARIAELRSELERRGILVLTAEGTYRERERDYGALATLWSQFAEKVQDPSGSTPSLVPGAIPEVFGAEGAGSLGGRRRSRAGRFGFGPPARGSGGLESMTAVWAACTERFRSGEAISVALVVEEATLLDAASRELLIKLSKLARRRPFLLVLELDSSLPSFSQWEEELLGRSDVDWVRQAHPHADLRETERLQEIMASLPSETSQLVGFVALLDGSTSEVVLARIARRRTSEIEELLRPALSANLLKVTEGRIAVAHESWVDHLIESIPEERRRAMHRIVAEGLEALSPEPNLQRRFQIAEHFFQAEAGPLALRHLVEASHLAERVLAFDPAEAALAKAIECIPSVPAPSREEMTIELRLERAKLLAFGGRPAEAEALIRDAVDAAVLHRPLDARMEELLLVLTQVVYLLGPRPTLRQLLAETADRFENLKWAGPEAVVRVLLAYLELLWAHIGESESEISKGRPLSEGPGDELAHVACLLIDAMIQLWNADHVPPALPRTLEEVRQLLRGSHLAELDLLATVIEGRLAELREGPGAGLQVNERGLLVAERTRMLWVELYLQAQRVGLLLRADGSQSIAPVLERSQYLVEILHLVPPSPGLLRIWGQEARRAESQGRLDDAREIWLDVLAHAGYCQLLRTRAQAVFRLAQLDFKMQAIDRAVRRVEQLRDEGLEPYLASGLSAALPQLAGQIADASKDKADN